MKDTNFNTYYQNQEASDTPNIPVVEMSDVYDLDTGFIMPTSGEPTDADLEAILSID